MFEEHGQVADALRANYAGSDDILQVIAIQRLANEVAELCNAREADIKATVRELSKRVECARPAATLPEPVEAHSERVESLLSAMAHAKENIQKLNNELRGMQEEQKSLQLKRCEVQQQSKKIEEMVSDTEPRRRHELSLYAHISSITWRFDKEGLVAGAVSDRESGDIRQFELDEKELSEFELVNQLWDVMS